MCDFKYFFLPSVIKKLYSWECLVYVISSIEQAGYLCCISDFVTTSCANSQVWGAQTAVGCSTPDFNRKKSSICFWYMEK